MKKTGILFALFFFTLFVSVCDGTAGESKFEA